MALGCNAEKKEPAPAAKMSEEQERGRRAFAATCTVCHEIQSSAAKQGPSLQGLFKKRSLPSGAPANDDRVRDAILYGRRDMPAYQYFFNDQQINDVIAYLHTL